MNECYQLTVAELKGLLLLYQVPGRSRFTTKSQICDELIRLGIFPRGLAPPSTLAATLPPLIPPAFSASPTPAAAATTLIPPAFSAPPTPATATAPLIPPAFSAAPAPAAPLIPPAFSAPPASSPAPAASPTAPPTSTIRYIPRPLPQRSRQQVTKPIEKTLTQQELNEQILLQQTGPMSPSALSVPSAPLTPSVPTVPKRVRRGTPEQRRRREEMKRQQEILMRQRVEKEHAIQQKLMTVINKNRDQLISTCLKYRASELVEKTQGKQEQGGSAEEEYCRDEELWKALVQHDYKTDEKLVLSSSWFNNYRLFRTKDLALNKLITVPAISQVLKRGMPKLVIAKEASEYLQNYLKHIVSILIVLPNNNAVVTDFISDYFPPTLRQQLLNKYATVPQFPPIINELIEQIGIRVRKESGQYIDGNKMRQIVSESS